MNITYIPTPEMNKEFVRARNFMYYTQCPEWMDWCGGGPLDNGAMHVLQTK